MEITNPFWKFSYWPCDCLHCWSLSPLFKKDIQCFQLLQSYLIKVYFLQIDMLDIYQLSYLTMQQSQIAAFLWLFCERKSGYDKLLFHITSSKLPIRKDFILYTLLVTPVKLKLNSLTKVLNLDAICILNVCHRCGCKATGAPFTMIDWLKSQHA